MRGVGGGDEVEGHVGRPADVLVGEGTVGPLVAAAHHALAHEVHAAQHEHRQDDGDDREDRAVVGREVLGRGGEICCRETQTNTTLMTYSVQNIYKLPIHFDSLPNAIHYMGI